MMRDELVIAAVAAGRTAGHVDERRAGQGVQRGAGDHRARVVVRQVHEDGVRARRRQRSDVWLQEGADRLAAVQVHQTAQLVRVTRRHRLCV